MTVAPGTDTDSDNPPAFAAAALPSSPAANAARYKDPRLVILMAFSLGMLS